MSEIKIVGKTEPPPPPPARILHGVCGKCGIVLEGPEVDWSPLPWEITLYERSPTKHVDCPKCGCSVFGKDGHAPDHLRAEPAATPEPQAHQHTISYDPNRITIIMPAGARGTKEGEIILKDGTVALKYSVLCWATLVCAKDFQITYTTPADWRMQYQPGRCDGPIISSGKECYTFDPGNEPLP